MTALPQPSLHDDAPSINLQPPTVEARRGDNHSATRSMNSAGVIRSDGHSKVHVGHKYTTIHYHADSNQNLTDAPHAKTDKAKLRTAFLKGLYTSPYEERKDRNPGRAAGTCEWFTAHRLFQNWQKETSAPLWVSADPGCGKSVLARYLVDEILPSGPTRTTCYFFFKDDFDDQRVLEGALCCILHQLFNQQPALLSDEILEDFEEEGDQLFASFPKLWEILIKAADNHHHGEIVCILDALDECTEQTRLAKALTQLYSKGKGKSPLKFLVTSRPYLRIQHDFQNLKESQPTIHLSGEGEAEMEEIAREITIVIQQRIEDLSNRRRLATEEKRILREELTAVAHRTYLWVHLVFASIDETIFLTNDELRAKVRKLPRTVEQAYNNILRKSRDPTKAKMILQVIIAADRPLHIPEMAAVLAFRRESHQCHKDLEQNLPSTDHLRAEIRETCGLFVVVQDSQIFLLHQTAREFLVRSPHNISRAPLHSLTWYHTLDLKVSHRLLSEICIRYLLLADFKRPVGARRPQESDDGCDFALLEYAASNWTDHYRQAHDTLGTDLERLALRLCDTTSPACSNWLEVYGRKRIQDPEFVHELPTSLLIISYFGLDNLVKCVLQDKRIKLDTAGASGRRTALSWACEKGYDSIVRSLLKRVPKYQVILKDKLLSSSSPTIVNQTDARGRSPLWYSATNGNRSLVEQLLKSGAKVNIGDENGLTPLLWATHHGHNDVVTLLLQKGARKESHSLETRDRLGRTPLHKTAENGNKDVVQMLLERGAAVDAANKYGWTALMHASRNGHDATVKQLLEGGAAVDAAQEDGSTALMHASENGHDATVKQLLERGAAVDAAHEDGWTALILASENGHDAIVKQLRNKGAKR